MIHQHWLEQTHERFAMLYVFEQRGDTLGLHTHNADEHHNVACLAGRVQVTVVGGQHWELIPGMDMALKIGEPHEVTALEPGTVSLHRYPTGKPRAYAQITERYAQVPLRQTTFPLRG